MKAQNLARIAGISYLVIFFAAIFANFLALESLTINPLATVQESGSLIRLGIIAFMLTVVFDVVVAWALQELYKDHALSGLSTLFRMMHAAIMGVAVFALPAVLTMTNAEDILVQVDQFNTIWLIGLFFFGIHLILLAKIIGKPKVITLFLVLAGAMYIVDTIAHFMLSNYQDYASLFLAMVAIPSIIGEMSLSIWLITKKKRLD